MQPRAFLAALGANRRGFNQLGGFPWNNHRWHAICSLIGNLQDWLPGVAGTEPRLGYRFWGVNYKKGACTSPLFHFQRATTNCPFSNRPHQQRLASTCREWPPAPPPPRHHLRSTKPISSLDVRFCLCVGMVLLAT